MMFRALIAGRLSPVAINRRLYHIPVLLKESCDALCVVRGGVYVDCTLGGGGHTREILERGGNVIGLDQDPDSIARVKQELAQYISSNRLEIVQVNFSEVVSAVQSSELGRDRLKGVDGVLFDLGVSSHQIDMPDRGFAFRFENSPLDMRMGGADDEKSATAADIVNTLDTESLADLLYTYGEERGSRVIAREIVAARPMMSAGDLVRVISRCTPAPHLNKTLARCFQALRVAVNHEMECLEMALRNLHSCVREGGRLAVISYHSLEDRRVKELMTPLRKGDFQVKIDCEDWLGNGRGLWQPLNKKTITPTREEVRLNNRSRSAKLRVAERV